MKWACERFGWFYTFKSNGFSHALRADQSVVTFRHYPYVKGDNWEGSLSPEVVD